MRFETAPGRQLQTFKLPVADKEILLYIVRGNRYSVPDKLCGGEVVVHISLDGVLKVYDRAGQLVARHLLKPVLEGWSYEPGHHRDLWQQTLPAVQRRSLEVYEEVARCS